MTRPPSRLAESRWTWLLGARSPRIATGIRNASDPIADSGAGLVLAGLRATWRQNVRFWLGPPGDDQRLAAVLSDSGPVSSPHSAPARLATGDRGDPAALPSGGDRTRPGRWRTGETTATGGQATQRRSNDEAGYRFSPVGDGGRGLGPPGGGLRDPQRAGKLPGVRRCAPSARRRCRGPAARCGPRVPGSQSSWLACAALPAPVSTPRPGWSRWPGTGTPTATSGSAICMPCRGTRCRSRSATSFRGIWGTTPDVVAEIHRVLRPGGRAGITGTGSPSRPLEPGRWRRSALLRRRRSTTRL